MLWGAVHPMSHRLEGVGQDVCSARYPRVRSQWCIYCSTDRLEGKAIYLDSILQAFVSTLTFCTMPDALKWRCASRAAIL